MRDLPRPRSGAPPPTIANANSFRRNTAQEHTLNAIEARGVGGGARLGRDRARSSVQEL